MNKKIKIIDVINEIANGEIPKAIKYHNKIYKYVKNEEEEGYLNADFGGDWLINIISWDDIKALNQEVEILEDNIEEIEELDNWFVDERKECREFDIQAINLCFSKHRDKINEIIRYIKRKDKNND